MTTEHTDGTDRITGRGGWLRNALDRVIAELAFLAMGLVKILPVDRAFWLVDRVARLVGPRTSRHKLMLYNLGRAFPDLDKAAIEAIASDSWANMGRMLVEYVYIDQLFDLDPARPEGGRVEIIGAERMVAARESGQPVIFVANHSACFEMLPLVASTWGFSPAILFRPPNNPYLAARIDSFRRQRMGRLIPSHAGSSLTLARALAKGGSIGVLVDQKYPAGIPTRFFGIPTETNPLVPKLVKQFDCIALPVVCQRIEANRYRVTVEPPMEKPRRADGSIDVEAMAQALNDQIEAWVRRAPGQWLWYHDRWNVKRTIGL